MDVIQSDSIHNINSDRFDTKSLSNTIHTVLDIVKETMKGIIQIEKQVRLLSKSITPASGVV